MRHAVLVSWLAMRTIPGRRVVLPYAAQKVARVVLGWLDRRRLRIDEHADAGSGSPG